MDLNNNPSKSKAVHTDLNKARKNERSIRQLKRTLAVLIVLLVGLGIFITYPYWLPKLEGIFDKPIATIKNDGKTEGGNFPIELESEAIADMFAVKNNLLVSDAHELTFYYENGRERSSFDHDFSNPVTKISGKYALVFDNGSDGFKLYTKSGEEYSKTAENTILTGSVGEDGTVVMITASEKYASALAAYDDDGNLIYRFNCTQRIMSATVKSNGGGCYICAFSSEDGDIYSQVHEVDFDSEEEKCVSEKLSCIAIECVRNKAGNISVVGDTMMYVLNSKGEIVSSLEYPDTLSSYSLTEDGVSLLLSGGTRNVDTLLVANSDSQAKAAYHEVAVTENVKSMKIYDDRVILLTANQVQAYAFSGTLAATAKTEKDYGGFVYFGSGLYMQSRRNIDKILFEM